MEIVHRSCRPGYRRSCGSAVIALEEVRTILFCHIAMRYLRIYGSHAALAESCFLLCAGARCKAAASAVIADAIDGHIVDDGFIDIHVPNDGCVHATYSGVVVKVVSPPVAAFISVAVVSVTVVHAAVEADVRTPVSSVPKVSTITPSPPAWRPQQAN
jgi:hypothetical protein